MRMATKLPAKMDICTDVRTSIRPCMLGRQRKHLLNVGIEAVHICSNLYSSMHAWYATEAVSQRWNCNCDARDVPHGKLLPQGRPARKVNLHGYMICAVTAARKEKYAHMHRNLHHNQSIVLGMPASCITDSLNVLLPDVQKGCTPVLQGVQMRSLTRKAKSI